MGNWLLLFFSASNWASDFNDIFLTKIIKKSMLEANMQQEEYILNEYLNVNSTEGKVKKATDRAKMKKQQITFKMKFLKLHY